MDLQELFQMKIKIKQINFYQSNINKNLISINTIIVLLMLYQLIKNKKKLYLYKYTIKKKKLKNR